MDYLKPLFLLFLIAPSSGCDRDDDAQRFANVSIRFSEINAGVEMKDLEVPYFRLVSDGGRTIGAVYNDPRGLSGEMSTLGNINSEGEIVYDTYCVIGSQGGLDVGNSAVSATFYDRSVDSLLNFPVCFPAFVPFDAAIDLAPGKRYELTIEVDVNNIHSIDNQSYVDARQAVAFVEEVDR